MIFVFFFGGYQGWPYGQDNILHWNAAASRGVSWWRRGEGSTMGYGSIGSIGWLNIIFISFLLIKMVRWCKMTVSPRKNSWFECFRVQKMFSDVSRMVPHGTPMSWPVPPFPELVPVAGYHGVTSKPLANHPFPLEKMVILGVKPVDPRWFPGSSSLRLKRPRTLINLDPANDELP